MENILNNPSDKMTLGNFDDWKPSIMEENSNIKISKMESVGNGNPSSSVLDSQSVNPTESSLVPQIQIQIQ